MPCYAMPTFASWSDISQDPLKPPSKARPQLAGGFHPRRRASARSRTLLLLSDADAAGLEALLATAPLMWLEALDLSHCGISSSAAEALMHEASQMSLPALDSLRLSH
jgi:hypothetical protein